MNEASIYLIEKAESKYKELDPDGYEKLISKRDFDNRYFTLTVSKKNKDGQEIETAVYTKGWSVRKLGAQQARFNDFIWSKLNHEQQVNQKNMVNDTEKGIIKGKQLEALNLKYRGKVEVKQHYLTDKLITIEETTEKQAHYDKLIKALPILKENHIEIPREAPTIRPIEEGVAHLNYFIPVPRKKTYYHGLIDENIVNIPESVYDETTLKIEIIKGVEKFFRENPNLSPRLWVLKLTYIDKGKEINFDITPLELKDNFIETIRNTPIFNSFLQQVASRNYDTDDIEERGRLVMDHFIIQTLKASITGGHFKKGESWFLERTTKVNKSHHDYQHNFSYGTVKDYPSKENGCFPKILHTVISSSSKVSCAKEGKRILNYQSMWRNYDKVFNMTTFKTAMSFENVVQMSNYHNYFLVIHNEFGEIIYNQNHIAKNGINSLHIIYYDNHYFHLLNYVKPCVNFNEESKLDGREKPLFKIFCTYDLETIPIQEVCTPYLCQYEGEEIDIKNVEMIKQYEEPSLNIFKGMFNHLINNCLDRGENNIEITLNAYNGAKFDHHMLLKFLILSGYKSTSLSGNSAVLNSGSFRYFHKDYTACIKLWDICQFLNMSLKMAIKKFDVPIGDYKDEANHDEIAKAFHTIGLDNYFKEHPIDNYASMDVIATKLITNKIITEFRNNIKPWLDEFPKSEGKWDPRNYATLASMVWSIYTTITNKKYYQSVDWRTAGKYDNGVFKVGQEKGQNYIRSTMVAGRVEGVKGEHVEIRGEKMLMLDVVSLYPSVMIDTVGDARSAEYPCGDASFTFDCKEAKQYFNDNKLIGMYYVRYNQYKIFKKYGSNVLPLRSDDAPLNWGYHGTVQGLLTSVDIKQLLLYGGDVEFIQNGEMPCGIMWEKTTKTFETYINYFYEKKAEQDRWKDKDPRYNNALREIYKFLINALSGKPAQRIYKAASRFYDRNSSEFTDLVKDGLDNKYCKLQGIIAGGMDWVIVKQETDRFKSYPIQLSCFIYSYARKKMYDNIYSKTNEFGGSIYGDTDSCVVNQALYDDLISKGLVGDGLGQFKKEWDVHRIYVIQPKLYMIFGINEFGKLSEKYRSKGVQARDKWQYSDGEYYSINEDMFKYLLELRKNNEKLPVKTMAIKRINNVVYKHDFIKYI